MARARQRSTDATKRLAVLFLSLPLLLCAANTRIERMLAEPDLDKRRRNVVELAAGKHDVTADEIDSVLLNGDRKCRPWAAKALALMGTKGTRCLIQGLESGDAETRLWSAQALASAGNAAISSLIPYLDHPRVEVREAAIRGLAGSGTAAVPLLVDVLRTDMASKKQSALLVIGEIGPDAASAAPALADTLRSSQDNEDMKLLAATALARIGSGAIAEAIGMLDEPEARPYVLAALKQMDMDHATDQVLYPVVEAVLVLARNSADDQAQAMGVIAAWGSRAVAYLRTLLRSKRVEDRELACFLLGSLGAKARPAKDDLLQILKKEDSLLAQLVKKDKGYSIKANAIWALGFVAPCDAEVMKEVEQLLSHESAQIRANSCRYLATCGYMANGNVDHLLRLLASEAQPIEVRLEAANALGEIGLSDERVIRTLTQCLSEKDPRLCHNAAIALSRFGSLAVPAIPGLVENLKGEVFESAVKALSAIGAPAIPHLLNAAQSVDKDIAAAASLALAGISFEKWNDEVVETMRKAAASNNAQLANAANLALRRWESCLRSAED